MRIIDKNSKFLLEEVIKQNFAAKYKGSILGIFWSVLKPLLIMLLLTIIFSEVFGSTIKNFPVYILSGKCIYDFFSASIAVSMMSMKRNQHILKRIPAPKHIFVLGGIISEFINFLITLLILVCVMVATNVEFNFTMLISFLPLIPLFMMAIGVGLIFSILCVYYTDIEHLWSVIALTLMYGSAIFYPIEIIPKPFYDFIILNPLLWTIEQFRDLSYLGTMPDLTNMINLFIISAIVLVLGIIVFKRYEQNITMKF